MRARHYAAPSPVVRERERIERRLDPSARELSVALVGRLRASRPIVGDMKPIPGADGITTPLRPVYGKSTFRNVIENGAHV